AEASPFRASQLIATIARLSLGGDNEATRVHHVNRRCGGWVAAIGGRAAAANWPSEENAPTGYVNARRLRTFGTDSGAILPPAARGRLCRGAEYRDRGTIRGLACRKVAQSGGRAGQAEG